MDHRLSFKLFWNLCDMEESVRIENPQVGNLVLGVMPGIYFMFYDVCSLFG